MDYIFFWADENNNFFDAEHILLNYGIRAKNKFGYGIKEAIIIGKDFHTEFYLSKEEIEKSSENGYKFFIEENNFKLLIKEFEKAKKEMSEKMNILLKTDLRKLSNKELFDLHISYGPRLSDLFVCYSMTQPHITTKLESVLMNFLKTKGVKDINGTLSIITAPKTKFIFTNTGNILNKSFSESIKGENSVVDKNILEQDLFYELPNNNVEKNRILSNINPPETISRIIDTLGRIAEERLRMRFFWMNPLYLNELFLIELKRRYNIPKKILRMYETREIEDLILENKKVSEEVLKNREIGFVKILENETIKTLVGENASEFARKLQHIDKNIIEIKGNIASIGKATGKVVVFSYRNAEDHSKKIREMNKGDIIISEMTKPNIIEACKKAGAIITDEGGITSHAAIIARELKIPAIIGTKIATQVLRDGDIVEVDADLGIVKILYKKHL